MISNQKAKRDSGCFGFAAIVKNIIFSLVGDLEVLDHCSRCEVSLMSLDHEALYVVKSVGAFELPRNNLQLGLLYPGLGPLQLVHVSDHNFIAPWCPCVYLLLKSLMYQLRVECDLENAGINQGS
ncbi:hypothetical protein EDD21DRAFT_353557 [Dissophora ornata]|nr:hypothetical protein EDD21DRAFT_353557 [Dissophora ornata]